jgi:hypothetical protein
MTAAPSADTDTVGRRLRLRLRRLFVVEFRAAPAAICDARDPDRNDAAITTPSPGAERYDALESDVDALL